VLPTIITLEGEPRGWARPRVRVVTPKSGSAFASFFMDAKTRAFEKALKWQAKAAMKAQPPIEGPVSVRVIAAMAVPSSWSNKKRDAALAGTVRPTGKPDWDNFAKMLDAFNGIVWVDDAQIVDGSVSKIYSEVPLLRVEIRPAAETSNELPLI
jgi:Holliday junction resolvase RusA-like endonuclease